MNRIHKFKEILSYFPQNIRTALANMSIADRDRTHEIRLRICKPVSITSFGKELFLTKSGGLTKSEQLSLKVSSEDIMYSFKAVCDYSIHSYGRELSQGFITVQGGNRVGISGSAMIRNDRLETVKYVNGLNFRIAGQVQGCADGLYKKIFLSEPKGLLVVGSPASGKTTIIKDLCRLMGNRWRVSIIDERGEISATHHGEPQNDVGTMSDIFDGYPKAEGIETAIRVMTPDIVVCDEIGGRADVRALMRSVNAGVKIVATAHAGNIDEIYKRKHINKLIKNGVFDYVALLGKEESVGEIIDIRKVLIK